MVRVAALGALVAVLAVPAAAGELEDLRAENAKLKAQVAQLEKDLDAARNPKKPPRTFASVAELWKTLPRNLQRGPYTNERIHLVALTLKREAINDKLTASGRLEIVSPGIDSVRVRIDVGGVSVIAASTDPESVVRARTLKKGRRTSVMGAVDRVDKETSPAGFQLIIWLKDAVIK